MTLLRAGRARVPLALTVAALAACFHPVGSDDTGASGTSSASTSTASGTATSTSTTEPATATTLTTTTAAATTTAVDTTTGHPASTGPDTSEGSSSGIPRSCGNGQVDPGEECDDGNVFATDECISCNKASCGDGFVWEGMEGCDDANADSTDACVTCQAAYCGDGALQAGVEQCDDGNKTPRDGCGSTCIRELFIFASDVTKTGNIGGLTAADTYCQTLANKSDVVGVKQASTDFIAWLGTKMNPLSDRLGAPTGSYFLPSGAPVAINATTLMLGTLMHPIDEDWNGSPWVTNGGCTDPASQVWTGTLTAGKASQLDCSGWISTIGTATVGDMKSMTLTFTQCANAVGCDQVRRLYCVQKQ